MEREPDYFSNHRLKLRFPWRLYHDPIVQALGRVVSLSPGPEVLNIGSGPFFELEELTASGRRFTVCDVDARAIDVARERYGDRLAGADVIDPAAPLPYADQRFDLVVSMDVIEHVDDPIGWSREALRVLKRGGILFLTTPNYASLSLKLIEDTALELVARAQGFSRRHIHPTKMTPERLSGVLRDAGAGEARIEPISFGWVLSAYARRA
jgi:SAM-dependent methyltransferase